MEFNRNHYFMGGIVLLLLGIQLRLVDSYVLTEKATRFLAEHAGEPAQVAAMRATQIFPSAGPAPRKLVHPPEWLGWALMSVGSVLILQSLAMSKPDG